MEHASTVDIGARKRRSGGINEDSVATAVLENHHRQTARPVGVFVLGDGVGGEASGDVASFLATTVVRKRLTEELSGPGTDITERFDVDAYDAQPPTMDDGPNPETALSEERIRTAIQEGVDAAHKHVQEYAREIGARPATTVVVAVYADGKLHYGWVGDSRLYVINAEHEEITQLTRDHAVTNELLERGEIEDEAYARVHEDATAITNAIGGSGHGKPTVDVEFGVADVYRDDVLMVTSDGLIDAYPDVGPLRQQYQRADDTDAVVEEIEDTLVTDDEIRDIVLSAADLHEAVEELVEFANDRGGKDNLSITLARDPAADPTPDSLPDRGAAVEPRGRTAVDPGEDSGGSGAGGSDDGDAGSGSAESDASVSAADSPDVVSVGDGDATAAIAIPGEDLVVEVNGDVTVGRAGGDGDSPDIPLDVADDATVERINAAVEVDEDGSAWRVRDTSSSGTYVEVSDGEWLLLLSSEGAELHRQHGFDPGAAAEHDIHETTRLEDGTTFTLQDPRSEDAITCRFFGSVDEARSRLASDEPAGETEFRRFLT